MFLPEMRSLYQTFGSSDKAEFLQGCDDYFRYYGEQVTDADWEITRTNAASMSELREGASLFGINVSEGVSIRVEAASRNNSWTIDFDMIKVSGKWYLVDIW